MRRIVCSVMLAGAWFCAASGHVAWGDASSAELVPEDTCIIEVQAAAGTRVALDGKDQGTTRRFTYQPLAKGKVFTIKVAAVLPGGDRVEKNVLIQGGWRVRVPIAAAGREQRDVVVQSGHSNAVWSVAFSPDGSKVLSGSWDHTAVLWDAATGTQLRTFAGHRSFVHSVAVSGDGRRVLTGSADGTAILWDGATGTKLRTFAGHKDSVGSVALSVDGRRVLTGSADKTAILWDAATGTKLRTFAGHKDSVHSVALSVDGRRVLTGSWDKTAILWDAATGTKLRTFAGHTDGVTGVALSGDGRRILTGSWDGTAILWDAATGAKLRTFAGHTGALNSVALSGGGRHVLTGSDDKTAILWDAANGAKLRTLAGHTNSVFSVALSGDDRRVLTGTSDRMAILWDSATGARLRTFAGHASSVETMALSADARRLVTGSSDVSANIRDVASGTKLSTFTGHADEVKSVALSLDGRRVLTGSDDKTAILWNASTGKKLRTLSGHSDYVMGVAFSPDGRRVVTASFDKSAVVWDAISGAPIRRLTGHTDSLRCVAFSPNGRRIVTGARAGQVFLWDAATGAKVREFVGHRFDVHAVAFSRDAGRIVTGSGDNTGAVWDAATGRRIQQFQGHLSWVVGVTFSTDGHRVLTGSDDRTAILWDAESGKRLQTFAGHHGAVKGVAFVSNGRQVITGSTDGTIRLWDIATGDELYRLVNFSNDRDWLVITPQGLFDGSEAAMKKVMFRIGKGLNVVPVSRFFRDLYTPGLLAELRRGERPMPKLEIGKDLPPLVKITSPETGGDVGTRTVGITVEATDQGGGIAAVVLRQNGAKVGEARPTAGSKSFRHTFSVNLVEGKNEIRIESACGDGSFESEPARMTLIYNKSLPRPDLYVLAVGINGYAEDALKLTFAAPDAKAMAKLFNTRGKTLYDNVRVTTLLDKQATKRGIREALAAMAKTAREQDTLVVFLSGHGFAVGQRYFFIPQDFKSRSAKFTDDVEDFGYPSDQLDKHMGRVKALKKILVLDTCNSGAALGKAGLKRRNPFAFAGAIRRLSRSQGIFTIAAAAASQDAIEIQKLGHGALTYSLLAGMHALGEGGPKHADVNGDGVVSVLEWFSHAAEEMPKLTKKHLGTAQDVKTAGEGSAFPVLPVRGR